MTRITAIQLNKTKKRVNVFFDNASSLIINKSVVEEMGLRKGMELSVDQMTDMMQTDQFHRCIEMALHYLAYRPRSELELRQRLYRRGFQNNMVNSVLDKLKNQGIINDETFAIYWKENRLARNPRSRRMLKYELQMKGVAKELADKATDDIDDIEAAYRVGLKKARLLASSDYRDFYKRLSNFLKWRGFDFDVISAVSRRLWQEKQMEDKSQLTNC